MMSIASFGLSKYSIMHWSFTLHNWKIKVSTK